MKPSLAAVDEVVVRLVVIGQQAAVAAGDAFGVRDVVQFAVGFETLDVEMARLDRLRHHPR